jgi:hypothetical protein
MVIAQGIRLLEKATRRGMLALMVVEVNGSGNIRASGRASTQM